MNFNKAEFVTSYGRFAQMPLSDKTEIAFAGRSNVGKSSLINKIFNRKSLARVSSVPGKTITINFYKLEEIFLVDLPGYGYAKAAKSEQNRWSELIDGYLTADRNIELIFQLIDMRHMPTENDMKMLEFLVDMKLSFVIVLTKADKLNKTERAVRTDEIRTFINQQFFEKGKAMENMEIIEFSSITGDGVDKIREIISDIGERGTEKCGESLLACEEEPPLA